MKKQLIAMLFLGMSATGFAQNVNDEFEVLRDMAAAERRALVADNMMFTEEESKIFWPLFDEYRTEAKKIGTREFEIINSFADSYEGMTNEQSLALMNDYYKLEMDKVKLKTATKDKMVKVLNPQLVMRFMQIENKIDAIIRYAVAAEVPLAIKK